MAQFNIAGLDASEILAYFDPRHPTRVIPALRLNGSISLDSPPFNQLHLTGQLGFACYIWPWYDSAYGVPMLTPTQSLHLAVNYGDDVDLGHGITLTDVYVTATTAVTNGMPISAGLTVTVGGSLAFDLGQSKPMTLNARVTLFQGNSELHLRATLENWEQPFGIKGLVLNRLSVFAFLGGQSPAFGLKAQWAVNENLVFQLEGQKLGNAMAIGASVGNLSFSAIGDLFRSVTGGTAAAWEHNIVFQQVFVGVANMPVVLSGVPMQSGLTLQAVVDIYDFPGVKVRLSFGSGGIEVFGEVPFVPSHYLVDGMTLNNITLQLLLPSQSAVKTGGPSASSASLLLSAGLTYKGFSMDCGIYLTASRQLLVGRAAGVSLHQLVSFVESGSPWDLRLEEALIAFSPQMNQPYPYTPVLRQRFPYIYATNPSGLMLSAVVSIPFLKLVGLDDMKAVMAVSLGGQTQRIR